MFRLVCLTICALSAVLSCVRATVYFREDFGEGWEKRWTHTENKPGEHGKFVASHGKHFGDATRDVGIKTSQDAKFYGISAKFPEPFSNKDKTLVIQFIVKHEQSIDCGGGYVKIVGSDFVPEQFDGETPYKIMFGPDICGMTKKVHVIFTYKGENKLIKHDISCEGDEMSHLYTLIVKPDNKFQVLIDNKEVESGEIEKEFDMLPPKEINDPKVTKPADWDDNEKIVDEADVKPEDWDQPETIIDPKAEKPADWDDEMDGEWEAPKISNPDYKGEWHPKMIGNPNYKGEWVAPVIPNPDYVADPNLYLQTDMGGIGFDLWQVKSGTIFDSILITDDEALAKKEGEEDWQVRKEAEQKLMDEETKKAETAKPEETDDEDETGEDTGDASGEKDEKEEL